MTTKFTRRELAVLATASLAAAQTPPAPNAGWDQAALDSHKQDSAVLAKFQIGMFVEPAFRFQA